MNLAMGAFTPQETFDLWMNSPGHKAHIQNPNHKTAAVGCMFIRTPWYGGTWDTYYWALAGGY